MSRIIKFRVWDTYNTMMVFDPFRFRENTDNRIDDERFNSPFQYAGDWQDDDDGVWRPCQVMQFTGHLISGADLYEGDIVRIEENADGVDPSDKITYYVVTWIKEWCMFSLLRIADEYREYIHEGAGELDTTMFWTFPLDVEDMELSRHYLCGNIYENPDLINPH